MALPLLPGNSFNRNLGKDKFHKSQHFGYCNEVSMMVGAEKPGIGGEPLLGQNLKPKYSVYPRGIGSDAPSWVAFDKQVLSFDAYFEEDINERRDEAYRIRQCKIYFYLEDDTIQVVEPHVKNSGIPQGTIVRRHRIPLPPPNDDQFYNVHHFNIKEIVLYAKPYVIVNCDQFTQNFLRKLGVRLNPPGSVPRDEYSESRQKIQDSMKPLRPYERMDTLRQFLEHDRHVLRFYGMWDDTPSMFGDLRELILHYYLADDTVEILEVIPPNAGRDAVPVFIHRGKLPKYAPLKLHQPGEITARTVLNVFGPMGHGGRYIIDNLKTGAVHHEFYTDCDLTIGAVINLWGRNILLCDCDPYTQDFYKTKYGIEDFTPIQRKAPPLPKAERKFPPYNGFGSEEDSLCSCLGMLPKPPQRDFMKFMEKDRRGLESNELRFLAKLVSDNPIDKDRLFIICYFLSDDTISVFEPPQRNSGIVGGKFLERGRIKKPGQEAFKSEMSDYFKAQDLFVGARVLFNYHNFILVNADEYTFNYMEKHANEFPMADISIIISKIRQAGESKSREIKQLFAASDTHSTSVISYDQFRNLLARVSNGSLSEHEIMAVGRHFSVREQPEVDMNVLLTVAQEQLKRKSFEEFSKLNDVFTYNDRERNGLLSSQQVRTVCKAFRMPLADDILRAILSKLEDEQGRICYQKLSAGLNWRENPIPLSQTGECPTEEPESNWCGQPSSYAVKYINYLLLLEELFGLENE